MIIKPFEALYYNCVQQKSITLISSKLLFQVCLFFVFPHVVALSKQVRAAWFDRVIFFTRHFQLHQTSYSVYNSISFSLSRVSNYITLIPPKKKKDHLDFDSIMEFEKKKILDNEPNWVKLKYVKLGYHYLVSNAMYLVLVPLTIAFAHLSLEDFIHLFNRLKLNIMSVTLCTALTVFFATLHFLGRPKHVYLLDFACYKPEPALMCSKETFMKKSELTQSFSEESLAFQKKILEKSGYGQKTYVSKSLLDVPMNICVEEARKEAEMVMFGVIDKLLAKTRVKVKDIGILVVNCSVFNPTPSLSAMLVNRYKLRGNILSYNLGGMGCSAGLISVDLAKRLLQVCAHVMQRFEIILSTEATFLCTKAFLKFA